MKELLYPSTDWGEFLKQQVSPRLLEILNSEEDKHGLCPNWELIFHAFEYFNIAETKVVILGQAPYPSALDAQGLAFSVPDNRPRRPSLRTIETELLRDLGIGLHGSGNLKHWAEQGVLLLNRVLTLRNCAGYKNSNGHTGIGWEDISVSVLRTLSELGGITFMLWGTKAQSLSKFLDKNNNQCLMAAHPSPLAGLKYNQHPFIGCSHFSLANEFLISRGRVPINWGKE